MGTVTGTYQVGRAPMTLRSFTLLLAWVAIAVGVILLLMPLRHHPEGAYFPTNCGDGLTGVSSTVSGADDQLACGQKVADRRVVGGLPVVGGIIVLLGTVIIRGKPKTPPHTLVQGTEDGLI